MMKLSWLTLAALPSVLAENKDEETCRLWLAPSNLGANNAVKYGLYAGVDYEKDDILPDVELAIPFIDFFVDANKQVPYSKGILDYLESQMWTTDHSSAKFEGNISATPFVPGLGVLGTYHALITNADWLSPASFLRERTDITEPGKPHLTRGAISEIVNVSMVATHKIPAGMEIHPNFGDLWDKGTPSPFQDTITRKDIAEADKIVDRIVDFYDRFEAEMNDDLKEDMIDFMLDKILGAAGGQRAALIRSLIPQNYKKMRKVKEAGGTFMYRNKEMLKKPKWFEKNGVCVDTMYVAKSTIPEAGRGAFASRNFQEDDRITLIPTLLFGQKDLMNMYEFVEVSVPNELNPEEPKVTHVLDPTKLLGQQVGMNYAYGHSESSLLLLPTSPIVNFVNHKSTPNAQLQWSTHPIMYNDQATWDHSVEEVMNFRSNMVVLELVATKQIRKGDEIFIDYGEEWVQAWERYREMWEYHYKKSTWPLRAEDIKVSFKNNAYPTTSQGGSLPPGILIACYIQHGDVPDGTPSETDEGMTISRWVGPIDYKNFTGALLTSCELLEYHEDGNGSYNYTVVTKNSDKTILASLQVNDVPHNAVTVVDAPYSSDLHFPDAFRHYIGIPDEIFPQRWRDLRAV